MNSITAWYRSCKRKDQKVLQRVINVAQNVNETKLPAAEDIYKVCSHSRTSNTIRTQHTLHTPSLKFSLLAGDTSHYIQTQWDWRTASEQKLSSYSINTDTHTHIHTHTFMCVGMKLFLFFIVFFFIIIFFRYLYCSFATIILFYTSGTTCLSIYLSIYLIQHFFFSAVEILNEWQYNMVFFRGFLLCERLFTLF